MCLVLDNPLLDTTSATGVFLADANYVLLVIFCGEMGLKLLALGLVCECEASYLRDPWNVIDCVVVVSASLTQWGGDAMDLSALKPLRALRAMRPLRAMRRFPGIRIIVEAMISSVPDVANVLAGVRHLLHDLRHLLRQLPQGAVPRVPGARLRRRDLGLADREAAAARRTTTWHKLLPEAEGLVRAGLDVTGGSWGAAGADGAAAAARLAERAVLPAVGPDWARARADEQGDVRVLAAGRAPTSSGRRRCRCSSTTCRRRCSRSSRSRRPRAGPT